MSLVDGKFFEVAEGILMLESKIYTAKSNIVVRKISSFADIAKRNTEPMKEWQIERLKYNVFYYLNVFHSFLRY